MFPVFFPVAMRKLRGYSYSRIFIPAGLRQSFGRSEYPRALHTQNRRTAEVQDQVFHAEAEKTFQGLRLSLIGPDQITPPLGKFQGLCRTQTFLEEASPLPTAEDLFPSFVNERVSIAQWKPKTRQESENFFGLFIQIVGNNPVQGYIPTVGVRSGTL